MKKRSNSQLLMFFIFILLFYVVLQTLTSAEEQLTPASAEEQLKPIYEVQQLPSGKVDIIIPGEIKQKDEGPTADELQAIADAKKDVKAHFNQTLWFTTGCFLPIIGPFVSQREIKSIPAARTLGKSPYYVAFYIDAYEIYMKKQRYNWALGGCIVGGLVDACLLGILIDANTN